MLSSIVHLSAIVLILAAIDARPPQGAGDFASGEIGIVLSNDERENR